MKNFVFVALCASIILTLPAFAEEMRAEDVRVIPPPVFALAQANAPTTTDRVVIDASALQTLGHVSMIVCTQTITRHPDRVSSGQLNCDLLGPVEIMEGQTLRVLDRALPLGEHAVSLEVVKQDGYAIPRSVFTTVMVGPPSVSTLLGSFPWGLADFSLNNDGRMESAQVEGGKILESFSVYALARVAGEENPLGLDRQPSKLLSFERVRDDPRPWEVWKVPDRDFCRGRAGRIVRPVIVVQNFFLGEGRVIDYSFTVPGFCPAN